MTAPTVTMSSMTLSWLRVSSTSLSGWASTSRSPLSTLEARTRRVGPPDGDDGASKNATWVPSAPVVNPVMGPEMTGVYALPST